MSLVLNIHNLSYKDLHCPQGLKKLDQHFLAYLQQHATTSHQFIQAYRQATLEINDAQVSEHLIACATHLDNFIAQLFNIEEALGQQQKHWRAQSPMALFKHQYLAPLIKKSAPNPELASFSTLNQWLASQLSTKHNDKALAIAELGINLFENNDPRLETFKQWCIQCVHSEQGRCATQGWDLFQLPQKLDYQRLIPLEKEKTTGYSSYRSPQQRQRNGFKLSDQRMSSAAVQQEIHYCVYCHQSGSDFCSKGFPVKKKAPELGLRKNPIDNILIGCPLDERISEMHCLKRDGYSIGALAMIMLDNPMCPATGHRICNDCMKACIYQKQSPVNIPQIETRCLTDVLDLPWGVEVYDLLSQWNPLRNKQALPQAYQGKKVMIAGLGPAGFTLAHHLLQEGFAVLGFDGLKIEPMQQALIDQPIRDYSTLVETLDERQITGFGGVAEYGITVRWDKNFLKLIYLTLSRRKHFQCFGSVRFGGTIHIEDAWAMGFDHFAIAVGAGLPKALPIPNSMANGMRQANDFLMALQLSGAAKKNSLANLQIELPLLVIGGGLTGIDAATEAKAYYIVQVEKIQQRYESLQQKHSDETILNKLSISDINTLNTFLKHAKEIATERTRAAQKDEPANLNACIERWGGVHIVYRKSMQDSPAYRNNHEELHKALEEGIHYIECLAPKKALLDQDKKLKGMLFYVTEKNELGEWTSTLEEHKLSCRSALIATGASANIAYAFEHKNTFERHQMQYQRFNANGNELELAEGVQHCKQKNFGPFTSYKQGDKRVTFIGDTHPVFHGSVVKAIASAMRTYPAIVERLKNTSPQNKKDYASFKREITELFTTTIIDIQRQHPQRIEITVKSPQACKNYRPGEFYRLQNYEHNAEKKQDTMLQSEGIALLASDIDKEKGHLRFLIIEHGASRRITSTFKIGQSLALMGPTGVRSPMPKHHETILIIGTTYSLAHIQSYGKALKDKGHRVLFICQLEQGPSLEEQEKIEAVCDQIIWLQDTASFHDHVREQDLYLSGKGLLPLWQYLEMDAALKQRIQETDRIQIIAQAHYIEEIQYHLTHHFKSLLIKQPSISASVYGPMQCMLKGVCAQCLQWQIDPETGLRTKAVYACSWQDQPLELIDIDNISERLAQNRVSEHINNLYIQQLLKTKQ